MFFSTVVLNGANTPLMHPEMQFRRIVFSTFCPRASFHTAWVTSGPEHPQQGVLIEAPLLDHGMAPRQDQRRNLSA
jgi:hypothetical protein